MRSHRRLLWPDARQTLLLHAAIDPAPDAVNAWSRVGPGLDTHALDPGSERLLPLVWSNLTRQGAQDARLTALARRHQVTVDANRRLVREAGELIGALGAAGIPTVVLKGGALITGIYDDPGARPLSDVDVLVPLPYAADAGRVLRGLGFASQGPMTPAALRLTHAMPWARPDRASIDLHWHVFEECCRAGDDDDLWAASTPAEIGGAATRVLAREDQLVHVCVHGEKWVHVPGIRWIADAVAIIRRGGVRWERLVEQAAKHRFAMRLHAQLAYLADEFAVPIPAATIATLAAAPTSRLERFEHRFAVRDRRRPWALVYWCNHVRATPGGLALAAATFPRYLQAVWRLESLGEVPLAGIARVARQMLMSRRP